MNTCDEVNAFMTALVSASAEIGVPPEVSLTVMLFETGSTLSAWFHANTNRRTAYGILQWTVDGCEPAAVQQAIGIPNPAANSAKADECYLKMEGLNRIEQLKGWKAYHKYWYKAKEKTWADVKDPYLKHYILTIAPNGGPNYKDGNGVSAVDITQGKGAVGKNFAALKQVAAEMLAGKRPVPGEDQRPQKIVGQRAMGPYLKAVGSCLYKGGGSPSPSVTTPAGSPPDADGKAKSISDVLPVELTITLPEYPRLVSLKPGDVLILPKTSQLRDWVVTSVDRTFTAGMNTLSIKAARPLAPKPFVQDQALAHEPLDPMAYYYGGAPS